MDFSALGVSSNLVKGLNEMGIKTPTEIQTEAIPILLNSNTDFVGKAQTGTGKTAAFGVPLLSKINPKQDHVQGLILAPTRELGQQIAKQLFKFTKYTDRIFVESVYGGEKIDKQVKRLQRTTHIIVATPGRLVELIDKSIVDLSRIHTVVLDEADEMLSMGFKKDLDHILNTTKGSRSIWLFSATMPTALNEIIKNFVRKNANRISVDKNQKVNKHIDHQFVLGEDANKLDTLAYFLKTQKNKRGIIFTRTKSAARTLVQQLKNKNYEVEVLEGEMTQKERDKVMRAFKNESLDLLVSTDVAARGIDVVNLAFVVHYQLPDQIEYYTHRSGRTARGGKYGLSLALVDNKEIKQLRSIEKELGIRFHQVR